MRCLVLARFVGCLVVNGLLMATGLAGGGGGGGGCGGGGGGCPLSSSVSASTDPGTSSGPELYSCSCNNASMPGFFAVCASLLVNPRSLHRDKLLRLFQAHGLHLVYQACCVTCPAVAVVTPNKRRCNLPFGIVAVVDSIGQKQFSISGFSARDSAIALLRGMAGLRAIPTLLLQPLSFTLRLVGPRRTTILPC